MFIKDNKAILYDESDKKDMKNSMDYLNIDKLNLMFPKEFIDDIQNFAVPKLDYQNVRFHKLNLIDYFCFFINKNRFRKLWLQLKKMKLHQ